MSVRNKFFELCKSWPAILIALGNFLLLYLLYYIVLCPALNFDWILLTGSSIILGGAVFPIIRKLLHDAKGSAKVYVLVTVILFSVFVITGYFVIHSFTLSKNLILPQCLPAAVTLPGLIVQLALLGITHFHKHHSVSPMTK